MTLLLATCVTAALLATGQLSLAAAVILAATLALTWNHRTSVRQTVAPASDLERHFKTMINHLPVGVVEISVDGQVLLANRMARQILAFSENGNGETLDFAALEPRQESGEPLSEDKTPLALAARRRRPVRNQLISIRSRLRKDLTWIQVDAEPLFDQAGEVSSVVMSFTDVTLRKEHEATIQGQQAELMHASRLSGLGVMAGGMAHEINNPLTVIKGRIDILRLRMADGPPSIERLERDLEIMDRNVERIADITRTVRQLAGDGHREQIEKVKLATIIETALLFCRERLSHHGIDLVHELTSEDVEIECSWGEITQALFNVLQNAYDAVESVSGRWVRLSVKDLGSAIEIRISDSGPGIAPGDRDKILLPFFTTKAPGKGRGLGLSVAQRLLERHGGSIRLDAEAENTTFVIQLPKEQERRSHRQGAAA